MRILAYLKENGEANPAEIVAGGLGTRGGTYTTLNRLEEAGFVESRHYKDRHTRGQPLRYFKITAKGVTMLAAMKAADRVLHKK